jgi:hypothetical protein
MGATIKVTLMSAIFKTTLKMLFFALALSWVKELTENIIHHYSQLRLKLGGWQGLNKKEILS